MDGFLSDASEILQTARRARAVSRNAGDYSIFLSEDGQVRMVAGDDGVLESMARHYGAQAAFRVTQREGVMVEGVSGERHCRIGDVAGDCRWLQNRPRYQIR